MGRHIFPFCSLVKLGAVGAGIAASITATVVAVKTAASSVCQEAPDKTKQFSSSPSLIPQTDLASFQKWDINWDKMEPSMDGTTVWPPANQNEANTSSNSSRRDDGVKDEQPKAIRHIFLIRHGQFTHADNDCDRTLTELGKEQAAFAGKKLGNMGIKFSSITSSSFLRAIQTANIILQNIDEENKKTLKLKVKDPLLSEGYPCQHIPYFQAIPEWKHRAHLLDEARIEAGFRKYFHRAEPTQQDDTWEIIVCHANVIRYFTCRALQFPPEGWHRMKIDHCSITRFTILPNGEVILRGLGDSGHIPYEKQTVFNLS